MRGILGAVTVCALALTVGAVPAAEADGATTSTTTSTAGAAGWATRLDRPGTQESGTRISSVGGVTYAAATTGEGRDRDVVVARLSSAGRVQWTREAGTARGDVVTDVVARPDGVLVLSATTRDDGEGYDGYTVSRYDAAGERLWSRTRANDGSMTGLAVLDDSYYVVGQERDVPVVLRLALDDGEQLARSAAPGPVGVTAWQSVAVLRDDVVVLGAAPGAGGGDGRRMGLTRLDGRDLTRDWAVAVDTAADDYPARVRVRDGRVLVAGSSIVGGDPNSQEYAMAVGAYSSDGTRQWLRRVGSGAVDTYIDLAATPRGPVLFATATTLFGDLAGMTLYPFGQDGTPRERATVGGEYPSAVGGAVEWDDRVGLLAAGTDLDATFGPSTGGPEAFVVQAEPAATSVVRRGVRITLTPTRAVVRPGTVRAVRARLTNAGSAATRLRVQGCTPGRGVVVRAFAGGREVTGAVRRGTWRTGSLAPGESTTLTLRVRAQAGTRPARLPCRVTVRDDAAPTAPRATASDAVQILVRATRRR